MLGACITFGLLAPVSKSLFGTGLVSAYALTMMRMGGGTVVFWIASLFTRREHVPPRDLLLFFFASLLGIVLNQGTYVLGVSKTSPIDASVVTTTTPIFVMIIAALYLREPITGKKILGVVVGAAGALLLILSGAHLVSGRTGSVLFVRQPCGRYDERESEQQVMAEMQGKVLDKDRLPWVGLTTP